MEERTDFEENAKEAEELAAAAVHPLVKLTFQTLARAYRRQAEEEVAPDAVPTQSPETFADSRPQKSSL